jgi:sigma-B regulation protein RsbU (phosphoserine phosphatase)
MSTAAALSHINNTILTDSTTSMFVTAILGCYDTRDGKLLYTNAGHNSPFVIKADGRVENVGGSTGPPAGRLRGRA